MKWNENTEDYIFWGKFNVDECGVETFHPLEHHCADVAAVAEAFFRYTISGTNLINSLNFKKVDKEIVIQRLCVLVAMHDLGKFNLCFQYKIFKNLRSKFNKGGHVDELLRIFYTNEFKEIVHAIIGKPRYWFKSYSQNNYSDLLISSICHHGKSKSISSTNGIFPKYWKDDNKISPLNGIKNFINTLKKWYPEAFKELDYEVEYTTEFTHFFCGLVIASDWIGSSTNYFPYSDTNDDRIEFARKKAKIILENMGVSGDKYRSGLKQPINFKNIIGFNPRSMQSIVGKTPLSNNSSLTIIESETGSGKTEAAFFDFIRKFDKKLVDGMYFALPTRTAAFEVYKRLVNLVEKSFTNKENRPAVSLAVPGCMQVDNIEGVPGNDRFTIDWKEDVPNEDFKYKKWSAESSKKYMLGSIVVGTIDQILMSSLPLKFTQIRSFALLRHLVVVDEVHASDAYMNKLLEDFLKYHFKFNGHALLMSATLGAEQRIYFESIILNNNENNISFKEAKDSAYPAIHYISNGVRKTYPVDASQDRVKYIKVNISYINDEELVKEVIANAKSGARVIIIRNTVTAAIETHKILDSFVQKDPTLKEIIFTINDKSTLHHSRFCKQDRDLLDNQIEKLIGKNSLNNKGCIIIGTQTLQQSLDIDGDIVYTDICHMDVLLQRLGRVHRHADRDPVRPEGFKDPTCVVLLPKKELTKYIGTDGKPRFDVLGPGIGSVYEDLSILQCTVNKIIKSKNTICIPDNNRDLVESSIHSLKISELSHKNNLWQEHIGYMVGRITGDKQSATKSMLHKDLCVFGDYEQINEGAMTRLGDPDITIHFDKVVKSPFGNNFNQINIPYHMSQIDDEDYGEDGKLKATCLITNENIEITCKKITYVYNSRGLSKKRD